MADRRPAGVSIHDWQHQLINERRDAWLEMPKTKALRAQRREEAKKYIWTLADHLRQFHTSYRGTTLRDSSASDLERLHEGYHEDDV